MKLIPFVGILAGILSIKLVGRPISIAFHDLFINKLGVTKAAGGPFSAGDVQEYLWWLPTGLLLGLIAGGVGMFLKGTGMDILSIVGSFLIGVGIGWFIGSLIIPFAEDIPIVGGLLLG